MSADNWAICPRCVKVVTDKKAEIEQKLRESYGKVSRDEYLDLLQATNAEIEVEDYRTFREDYEIGVYYKDNQFFISYRGRCTKCGLEKSFKHTEVIP